MQQLHYKIYLSFKMGWEYFKNDSTLDLWHSTNHGLYDNLRIFILKYRRLRIRMIILYKMLWCCFKYETWTLNKKNSTCYCACILMLRSHFGLVYWHWFHDMNLHVLKSNPILCNDSAKTYLCILRGDKNLNILFSFLNYQISIWNIVIEYYTQRIFFGRAK